MKVYSNCKAGQDCLAQMNDMKLPSHARVLVVGGGLAGITTAYFLAMRGIRDIVLIEKEASFCYRASGRNAALARHIADKEEITRYTVEGIRCLHQMEQEQVLGEDRLFSRCGSLLLLRHPGRLCGLTDQADRWKVRYEILGAQEVCAREPLLEGASISHALWFPDDGVIAINTLREGLIKNAKEQGVTFVANCNMTEGSIQAKKRTVVQTERGEIAADYIVCAAGAWATDVGGQLQSKQPVQLTSFRRHLFLLPRLGDTHVQSPFLWHLDDGLYIRQHENTSLLSGCDAMQMDACDPTIDSTQATVLYDKLQQQMPACSYDPRACLPSDGMETKGQTVWACLRTFTSTGIPYIGWDPGTPHLYWVAGLGGHGATGSTAIGNSAAQDIFQRLN